MRRSDHLPKNDLIAALTVLLLTNEALAQRTEGGRDTAIIYVHAHMHILVGVFEQLYFNLIFLPVEFDFVRLHIE